jgi:rhodanese-related sulfurtransferase
MFEMSRDERAVELSEFEKTKMKMKNLILALLICTLPVAPAIAAEQKPAATKHAAVKRVDVEEFDKLRANKNNVVLDVRTPKEFKEGHIPGAVNMDVRADDFGERIAKLDKDKTYLVHCAAGVRSANACKKLEGAGFKQLYDLAPGFRGWEKAGKPVEK